MPFRSDKERRGHYGNIKRKTGIDEKVFDPKTKNEKKSLSLDLRVGTTPYGTPYGGVGLTYTKSEISESKGNVPNSEE